MNIVGLVTEYNPFHNGHKYHLEMSKKITSCDYSICIMSGNFVQRGEPAIVDKFHRAKMAVKNGIDLVIELPIIYACRSAEAFAHGAITTLTSTNVVKSLSFGSECGNINTLKLLADIIYKEPLEYKNMLKNNLKKGMSFPKARSKSLKEYLLENNNFDLPNVDDVLSSSNNILGLEYLKALKKLDSNIVPYTYERIGSEYNESNLNGSFSSATAIRKLLNSKKYIDEIKLVVPTCTYEILKEFHEKYNGFNNLENYNDILLYLLRTNRDLYDFHILNIEKGLNDRIYQASLKNNDIYKIIDCIKTKRYTYTRIKRILMHILLNLDSDFLSNHTYDNPYYIRVLAMNTKGMKILKKIKKESDIPIITKFSDSKYLNSINETGKKILSLEKKATDIYFLPFRTNQLTTNLDYKVSPYIHKE